MNILYIFYFLYIYTITDEAKEQLKKEDLRMAHHLIKNGWNITHPYYAFLNKDKIRIQNEKREVSKEDLRMARHLRTIGFTIS